MKKIELTEGQKRLNDIEKVKKVFQYESVNIIIAFVNYEFKIGRKKQIGQTLTVLAPNGGKIPIYIKDRETLKSIQERTIQQLERFSKSGCDVKNELTRQLN